MRRASLMAHGVANLTFQACQVRPRERHRGLLSAFAASGDRVSSRLGQDEQRALPGATVGSWPWSEPLWATSQPARPAMIAPRGLEVLADQPGADREARHPVISCSGPATKPSSDMVKCQSTFPCAVCRFVSRQALPPRASAIPDATATSKARPPEATITSMLAVGSNPAAPSSASPRAPTPLPTSTRPRPQSPPRPAARDPTDEGCREHTREAAGSAKAGKTRV